MKHILRFRKQFCRPLKQTLFKRSYFGFCANKRISGDPENIEYKGNQTAILLHI